MATKRKSVRKGRKLNGKAQDPLQVATILAFARKETVVEACKRFGVADRTVRRYKQRVESGKWPEVASLLEQIQSEAASRCADLLTDAYEVILRQIIKLAPSMSPEQAIRAVETTGQLKITKEALGEPGSGDSSGQSPS